MKDSNKLRVTSYELNDKHIRFVASPPSLNQRGMALVLTLMMLAIMTAMVTEFSYGVYTTTSSLHNWKESQRLSFIARSGVALAAKNISDFQNLYSYTYPGKIEIPVVKIVDGFEGSVLVRVEDENSKFNLNSIINQNGTTNSAAFNSFKRLLRGLELREDIAGFVADWIDKDSEPRIGDSEEGAKNAYMDSVDELLLIKGIDGQVYEKLSPYVTVYGIDRIDANLVNINTAPAEVIMSMDDNITKELAERVAHYREVEPFKRISDLVAVAGFEGALGQSLMNRVVVKASNFRIISMSEDNRIKRIIESVIEVRGSSSAIKYWKEI